MAQLHLKIVTPEKLIFDEEVNMVTIPSEQGELGILPHHTNLMSRIIPGELRIQKNGKVDHLAMGGGFLQVWDNVVTILTDLAINAEAIDEKEVEAAKKRAEDSLEEKLSDEEYAETLAILEKSIAQLKVKRRHRAR